MRSPQRRYQAIDAPLGGIPVLDRLRCGAIDLLDAGTIADAFEIRVLDAGILRDLAEEVLAVDELEPPAPEVTEPEAEPFELVLLTLGDHPDEVRFGQATKFREALSDTVQGTGAGDDELHLREVGDVAVVQVSHELVGEEIADGWVGTQQTEDVSHRACPCDLLRHLVRHHPLNELEVIAVLLGISKSAARRGHDVCRGVDGAAFRLRLGQHSVVGVERIRRVLEFPNGVL